MNQTVALQLTGRGMGAIGVVLVAGEEAREKFEKVAPGRRGKELRVGAAVHCALTRPRPAADGAVEHDAAAGGESIDDAVVVRVGEDRYELHVHGGVAVMQAVLHALEQAGARIVEAQEAAAMGLFGVGIAGEVALALPRARTLTGARLLAAQIERGLAAFAREWSAWLAGKQENDLWRMHSAVQWVLRRSRALIGLLEPPRIAIVGPPNAGKSTLANALLGRQVSITSQVAGTTRDWVDAHAVFTAVASGKERLTTDHWPLTTVPVVLVDTAGVRETFDAIEAESIARTHAQARLADVVIVVLDGSRAVAREELALVERCRAGGAAVVAINKMDVPGAEAERWPGAVGISALRGDGLAELMAAVLEVLDLREVDEEEAFAFTVRQREVLEALAVTGDVRRARELSSELRVLSAEL